MGSEKLAKVSTHDYDPVIGVWQGSQSEVCSLGEVWVVSQHNCGAIS